MRDNKTPFCEYVFEGVATLCGSNALNVINGHSYCDHHAKMVSQKKDNFDRIRTIAAELRKIFIRDGYKWDRGAEEYLIRCVEEAQDNITKG